MSSRRFLPCVTPDVERALEGLYAAVEPGGYLLVTYNNEYTRSMFDAIAESPERHPNADSPRGPDRFTDRFGTRPLRQTNTLRSSGRLVRGHRVLVGCRL